MSGSAAAQAAVDEQGTAADVETRARAMGWKPQEEFRGNPADWRGADEFIRRGEQELPVLRERYRAQERQIVALRAGQDESTSVIKDLTERFRTADERAYKRARAELQKERDAAIEVGDKAAVHRADAELAELDETKPKAAAAAPAVAAAPAAAVAVPHPEAIAWHQRNPWYQSDPVLTQAALRAHHELLNTEPDLSVGENLERVTQSLRAMYPGRIAAPAATRAAAAEVDPDNPRRAEAGAVTASSASRGPARPNARSFANMPAESKDAYKRYAKQLEGKGKPLTEAEWATDYWSQFEEAV